MNVAKRNSENLSNISDDELNHIVKNDDICKIDG